MHDMRNVTAPAFSLVFAQLRDVRRELQDVLHDRDVAVARGAKVDDLEEAVSELRRHNKELEDQVRDGTGCTERHISAHEIRAGLGGYPRHHKRRVTDMQLMAIFFGVILLIAGEG